jgi:uncharacterized repeat protein (TIGR03803 family)
MTTKTSQGEETVLLAAVNALGQLNWGKLAYRKRMHGSRTVSTAERERGRTRWGSWLAWAVAALCLAQAQAAGTEKVLHNFGVQSSGAAPQAGLIRDSAGNFYGTASSLGPFGYGVVFKVDSAGQQTVLYNFTGGADGANPNAGPIRDAAGDFYSTTAAGGTSGKGVVYKLDTTGHETVLYNFTGGADGGGPLGVVFDPAGNLYGITGYGGEYDDGVVYKLDAAGNETVLHSFAGGADGEEPLAPAIRDAAGNLYGSTAKGGINQAGTIFKIDAAGVESVLYAFTGGKDGRSPQSPVILDSAGNLYGTTNRGGVANAGVVFKLSGAGQLTTLYSFPNSAQGHPAAGLVFDSAGNLYGTTEGLYPTYAGMVYKLNPAGQETTLYAFTGGADGAEAMSALVLDPEGNLYGTTYAGGPAKLGTVYEVSSTGQETVLYAFLGALDGALPSAGVIADPEGNLYGTTAYGGTFNAGTVFKVDPSGHQTILYNFAGGTDAAYPSASVTRDADGNLYGTTTNGGAANYGTVYKLDTTGHETVLYSFTGGTDGGAPYASVVLDPAGNLYGTAVIGGAHDAMRCSFIRLVVPGRPHRLARQEDHRVARFQIAALGEHAVHLRQHLVGGGHVGRLDRLHRVIHHQLAAHVFARRHGVDAHRRPVARDQPGARPGGREHHDGRHVRAARRVIGGIGQNLRVSEMRAGRQFLEARARGWQFSVSVAMRAMNFTASTGYFPTEVSAESMTASVPS